MDLDESLQKTIDQIDKEYNLKIEEETIISVSNSYISKYYLDKRLDILPKELKDGIKIMMVSFTEENGGILEMRYNDKLTSIFLFSYKDDNDYLYDEISAGIKLQKLEKESEELFNNLAIFCKMKFHEVDKFMEEHNKADEFFKMYYGCDDCGCGHDHDGCGCGHEGCECGHDDCDCDGTCDCDLEDGDCECGCGCKHEHEGD